MSHAVIIDDPYNQAILERLAKNEGQSVEEFAVKFLDLQIERAIKNTQAGNTNPDCKRNAKCA